MPFLRHCKWQCFCLCAEIDDWLNLCDFLNAVVRRAADDEMPTLLLNLLLFIVAGLCLDLENWP